VRGTAKLQSLTDPPRFGRSGADGGARQSESFGLIVYFGILSRDAASRRVIAADAPGQG
jgi:hypothetical protein